MAHLTLQLGANVVPFGDIRKRRRSRSCRRRGTELRLVAAAEAGLPVFHGCCRRHIHAYLLSPATDRSGGPLGALEA